MFKKCWSKRLSTRALFSGRTCRAGPLQICAKKTNENIKNEKKNVNQILIKHEFYENTYGAKGACASLCLIANSMQLTIQTAELPHKYDERKLATYAPIATLPWHCVTASCYSELARISMFLFKSLAPSTSPISLSLSLSFSLSLTPLTPFSISRSLAFYRIPSTIVTSKWVVSHSRGQGVRPCTKAKLQLAMLLC